MVLIILYHSVSKTTKTLESVPTCKVALEMFQVHLYILGLIPTKCLCTTLVNILHIILQTILYVPSNSIVTQMHIYSAPSIVPHG